jgi:hypothetical protein
MALLEIVFDDVAQEIARSGGIVVGSGSHLFILGGSL